MSGVKIFAIGVLVTGSLASSTRGGSIRGDAPIPDSSRRFSANVANAPRTAWMSATGHVAAENLAGGPAPSAPASNNYGGNAGNGLTLGVAGSAPINFSGSSFQIANNAVTSAPAAPAPAPASSAAPADVYLNFGTSPYADARTLTTGGAQPFYSSPAFTQFFQNGPTSQDITNFENQVASTVRNAYNATSHQLNITEDPNVPAAHTLSVVSGTHNLENKDAIGITGVGRNGFSFVDVLDRYGDARTASELATAVGNNVAHELMHAFGIKDHPEQSGPYIDAATTSFTNLADPSTAFSPVAKSLLSTLNFQAVGNAVSSSGSQLIDGDQVLVPAGTPVPEPATVALWGMAGGIALVLRRRGRASA